MCSNCGRPLVGAGDFCTNCGFPRPKLAEQLWDTGVLPRIRVRQERPSVRRIGKRLLIVLGIVGVVVALIVGGQMIFRPADDVGELDSVDGVIPDQPDAPVVAWTLPQATLFPGLGQVVSLQVFEPGRFDAQYRTNVLAAATNKAGHSQLISIDTNDGSVRWRVEAATAFTCSDHPIASGIACLYDSQLRVLLLDTGVVRRTFPAQITSRSIAVVGQTVLALSGRSSGEGEASIQLQAFSINGETLWTDDAVVRGKDVGLSTLGGVVAVTGVVATDGSPIVHLVGSGKRVALPAGLPTPLPGGRIGVSNDGQTRICTSAGRCSAPVDGTPVVPQVRDKSMEDLSVFIHTEDELRAYATDADQRWTRSVSASPTLGYCGDQLIVRDKDRLVAVSVDKGAENWQQRIDPATASLWCDGSRVMTFTAANVVSAFDLGDGHLSWTAPIGERATPTVFATTGGLLSVGVTWTAYK